MEPHWSHRFRAANGETDRQKLKLVPFVAPTEVSPPPTHPKSGHGGVAPTEAAKGLRPRCLGHIDPGDNAVFGPKLVKPRLGT